MRAPGVAVPNRLLKNGVLRPVKRVPEARRARNRPAEAYLSITLERGGRNAGTGQEEGPNPTLTALVEVPPPSSWTLKQRWAHFSKQVYEVDSLLCPRSGGLCGSSPSLTRLQYTRIQGSL